MASWRLAAVAAAFMAVSACTPPTGVPISFGEYEWVYGRDTGYTLQRVRFYLEDKKPRVAIDPDQCATAVAERTKAIDWGKAKTIDMTIVEGYFRPINVTLKRGQPYVFRVANKDAEVRGFRSADFFKASAVAGWKTGDKQGQADCITTVNIAANGSLELRLVPEAEGDYEIEDSIGVFGIPQYNRGGFTRIFVR